MRIKDVGCLLCLLVFSVLQAQGQSVVQVLKDIQVSSSNVVKLGEVPPLSKLTKQHKSSNEKIESKKDWKVVPDNFKGRRNTSKSIFSEREFQGLDLIRQKEFPESSRSVSPLVNIDGIGDRGSPHDPTGDVSDRFYVQMVNITDIGIFDLQGNLLEQFAANTLWVPFQQVSAGDPIVLYDENVDRWILTEFADPANVLIAISKDGDPRNGYVIYNFSTPNFPDYPKYGLSPNILTFTSNEEGPGELHQYFIDLKALYNSERDVKMQRVSLPGNAFTEAQFYVTTPVDLNGTRPPFDDRPMTVILNDSSWEDGPESDQIDLYSFSIDFFSPENTEVMKTSITVSPYDAYPCSADGFAFSCIPQKDGEGIDGVPEVIMNVPHQRNFGAFESIVLSFITDVTNGNNLSGIRWMELRRTRENKEWKLYQEGSFAPDDSLHRFMPSIAIDENANIGLAYNVSGENIFAGARFTGRLREDTLGMMTFKEETIVDGINTISAAGRFGDYSQLSVSPKGDNTFWYTGEYAGKGTNISQTRIAAFKLSNDSVDLVIDALINPSTSATLSEQEAVKVIVTNRGIKPVDGFKLDLLFNDTIIETQTIDTFVLPAQQLEIQFDSLLNLSLISAYDLGAIVTTVNDNNAFNDTLRTQVQHLYALEAAITGEIEFENCGVTTTAKVRIENNGADTLKLIEIGIDVNGARMDTTFYAGSIPFDSKIEFETEIMNLELGKNTINLEILSLNGDSGDPILSNNILELETNRLPEDNFIVLEITTDEYPEENQWTLEMEESGRVIASGNFEGVNETSAIAICAAVDSCFVLKVTDTFGDGLCCAFGSGGFNVYNNQGNLLISNNGLFESIAEERFCANMITCSVSILISTVDASSEGNADGSILIEASGGIAPYLYSVDGGITFQDSAVFNQLAPGDYEVVVADNTNFCISTGMATVGFTSSTIDLNGETIAFDIQPNPTLDVFKVKISGLSEIEQQMRVQILDARGLLLQSRSIGSYDSSFEATLSLMNYPSGTYFVRFLNERISHTMRMVKI